ncbi:hypothetical protein [Streptomyces sp. enrichment culture]|uniref:hypothetical protein n=1 Tax=Streptomyces sp. enrichment culture TaxID=1795815 RepID=UPI003F54EA49
MGEPSGGLVVPERRIRRHDDPRGIGPLIALVAMEALKALKAEEIGELPGNPYATVARRA